MRTLAPAFVVCLFASGAFAQSSDAVYSNLGTFRNQSYAAGGATQQFLNTITRMAADDLNLIGTPPYAINGFRFTVTNLNSVNVSASPLIRFYMADGPGGGPGTLIKAITYNPITFTAGVVGTIKTSTKFVLPSAHIWAGIAFDNNGGATGATGAQLDNLAQGIFSPATRGTSADQYFVTNVAGSFASDNPAGTIVNFGGAPPADFGWEILTAQNVDLSITKSATPTASPGGNVVYTIAAANAGPDTVFDARVVDTFPPALACTWTCAGSAGNTCAANGSGDINDATVALAPGGTVTYTATCAISTAATGTVVNTATIFSPGTAVEANIANNVATNNVAIIPVGPPSIAKAFGSASIPVNGVTTLTFTLTNPNAGIALSGVAFTDALSAGLVLATPNGLISTCGGSVNAVAGTGIIGLANGTLPASGSCTIALNVTGTIAGPKNNITTAVTSIEGGAGGPAAASITVVAPPAIAKAFAPLSILLNATSTLTVTLTNPNAGTALTGVAFTDNLPAGVAVATPNALINTCGGSVIAVAASGSIALANGSLAAGASCAVTVDVTGTTNGLKSNTTSTITSNEGGAGGIATAFLIVVNPPTIAPPTIAKAFGAASILLNGSTTLTFTVTNPNAISALTGIGFTDLLPPGLVVATPNGVSGACGGTVTATAGSGSLNLANGSLPISGTCTIAVNVTGTAAGAKNNITTAINSVEGAAGGTASANLTVVAPPSIAKAFASPAIKLNGTTTLTFTLTNPNVTTALTGISFSDTLPAGLAVATPNGVTSTCGGTVTAVAGSGSVALANGGLGVDSSCTIAVNITATTAGAKNNITTAITSTEGGGGGTAAASLTVVAPPGIAKAFGAASIAANATTTLTFTLTNANTATALTGVGFSDTLPAGLIIVTPNGLTTTCTGTITALAGTGSVRLASGSLPANGACTIVVNVTGTTGGVMNNTTTAITSIEGGSGGVASASITIVAPPALAKAFGAASIAVNAATTLTFTLTNPNTAIALTGVGFTDAFPAGLIVVTPNGLATT
jgi:uncharacterized repeat protein (TIGR01451 family)